jgi:uracil-DNA glycosylase family 4
MGDPSARILLVGLAPAAHGGNRTGRVFTGDRSGDVLFAALHRAGLASQPVSVSATDGLQLRDVYVAAVNRCAPPDNRPTPQERDACLPFLARELALLTEVRVIVALGAFAWDGALRALAATGRRPDVLRPRFGHAAEAEIGRYRLLASFHPSHARRDLRAGVRTRAEVPDRLQRVERPILPELGWVVFVGSRSMSRCSADPVRNAGLRDNLEYKRA